MVPYDQPTSVSFLIKAKKLGDITIKIEAVNHLRIDELEHILRVIPENHLRFKSEKVFINLTSHGKQKFYLPLDIPKYADQESVKIQALIDRRYSSAIQYSVLN